MPEERFIVDGQEQIEKSEGYRAARAEIIASVRSRYAESLASAGIFRRLLLRLRMQREINREVAKLAPPNALYLQSR